MTSSEECLTLFNLNRKKILRCIITVDETQSFDFNFKYDAQTKAFFEHLCKSIYLVMVKKLGKIYEIKIKSFF